ncbi:hypothetical protein BDV96DRAFT_563518 [Lophiotrema nucula]|uniref:Glycosyltransferase 2 n=1 Tax=Lophiotrema nucula TaxID=690887 RepID=A0A6A5ZPA7_9PLEO|nr:hypothetical protein BDV96DRAFT_563518 [Lophiotrema nucula]
MHAGSRSNRGWLEESVSRASMLTRTILPGDEELGKKDDDHKPGEKPALIATWTHLRTPLRWRRRRILLVVVGLYLVYVFFHNIPDLGEYNGRRVAGVGRFGRPIVPMTDEEHNAAYNEEPTGPPKGFAKVRDGEAPPHTYGGQIRFYRLASSLHAASNTGGYRMVNRNVLFGLSSLKSASTLLPMICEMARWKRNYVHAAFFGREDIPMAEILELNGITKEAQDDKEGKGGCPVVFHDARPDYMEWSTEQRAESSVSAAMTHIQSFLHPQVAIMDDSLSEDAFFVRGLRSKCKTLDMPIIEIPKDHWENFLWLSRLDAGSLRNWHKPTVDILIQAPSGSSGGLIRLLKSIKEADYAGLKLPRLTIELPPELDGAAKQYLENFRWPPDVDSNPLALSQVTLRRRIAGHRATQEESAIRFLELFFPTSTTHSHVLLLSPQAELSPQYFHYLKYVILEHKYSAYGEADAQLIMGASLELPSLQLDAKSQLIVPKTTDMHTPRYVKMFPEAPGAPFLWQAPNSHAALLFGDKWAELHSFLSSRVKKQHEASKAAARAKLVSETLPSWMEYVLELMRARGYSLYYPASSSGDSLVAVHNELYHPPEEFTPHTPTEAEKDAYTPDALNEPFLTADTPPPAPNNPESTIVPRSRPLHLAMPFEGDLPEISHLPYLLYNGKMIPHENVTLVASAFADKFRESVGGCTVPKGKRRVIQDGSARDLFCFGDEDEEDWEDDFGFTGADDAVERAEEAAPSIGRIAASTAGTASSSSGATIKASATAVARQVDQD